MPKSLPEYLADVFFFQVGVKKQTIFWEGETGYTPIAESFMIFSQFPRAKLMYTQIYKF